MKPESVPPPARGREREGLGSPATVQNLDEGQGAGYCTPYQFRHFGTGAFLPRDSTNENINLG